MYKGVSSFMYASLLALGMILTCLSVPVMELNAAALYGDVSGDGIVDSADYTIMRGYLLGKSTTMPASDWKDSGDVNSDGTIDSADFTILRKYLLKLISVFPVATTTITPTQKPTNTPTPTNIQSPTNTPTPTIISSIGTVKNPLIYADVPDPDVIRVGKNYYMSSTTMHMNPGVPIMKSTDLAHWEIVNYVYDTLAQGDPQNLDNGKDEYGKGSWASSLRYNNGVYYIAFVSNATGKTYIYQTTDIEHGKWSQSTIQGVYHDLSLLFDNGRVFMISGSNDIKLVELTSDAKAIKQGGINQVIISNSSKIAGSSMIVPAEGAHFQKINGMYYVFLICWPSGGGRTELCYRSSSLTGPYEGKVVLNDSGIAQGGIVDTPDGSWYGMLFKDSGSVGRIPYLVPVTWSNNWPIFGVNGKVPLTMSMTVNNSVKNNVISSDEFESSTLGLSWQWNHNPDNNNWSLTKRPGFMRLTNGRTNSGILNTKNLLTQRTFGPKCSGSIAIEINNMKDGDYAGFSAFQKNYGFVGVKMSGSGKSIVMVNGSSGSAVEVASVPLNQTKVYFKVNCDFTNNTDKATFFYSLDGSSWKSIGNTLQMSYTMPHFMGYRFALFNFATKSAGGYVDFDYFKVE